VDSEKKLLWAQCALGSLVGAASFVKPCGLQQSLVGPAITPTAMRCGLGGLSCLREALSFGLMVFAEGEGPNRRLGTCFSLPAGAGAVVKSSVVRTSRPGRLFLCAALCRRRKNDFWPLGGARINKKRSGVREPGALGCCVHGLLGLGEVEMTNRYPGGDLLAAEKGYEECGRVGCCGWGVGRASAGWEAAAGVWWGRKPAGGACGGLTGGFCDGMGHETPFRFGFHGAVPSYSSPTA